MEKKRKIVVLFGGQSYEHEVSWASAQSVIENLNPEKYDVLAICIKKDGKWLPCTDEFSLIDAGGEKESAMEGEIGDANFENEPERNTPVVKQRGSVGRFLSSIGSGEKIDVVFPVLHGCNGEDGSIQGLLELAGVPYVGCGILASAVGMDKAVSKILFEHANIPQGKYLVVMRSEIHQEISSILGKVEETMGYPCFIKPSNSGSSVGVSKVENPSGVLPALLRAGKYDRKILIEEFINGREVECAVLGNDSPMASAVGEVVPCNEFYDYKAKYIDGDSKIIIPAELDDKTIQTIRDYAVTAFKKLDCTGLARVDFFVERRTSQVFINEINTMPGFTDISMYSKLWQACGISYAELLDRLIELAYRRFHGNQKSYEREI